MSIKRHIDWLFVLPDDLIGGGAQHVLYTLISYLIKKDKKCEVVFLVTKRHNGWEKLESKCKITYLHFNTVKSGYIGAAFYLSKLSRSSQIDHIITSQTLVNGLVGFLKKIGCFKNSKIIMRESTSIFLRFSGFKLMLYSMAYKMGYSEADLVICQTQLMKEQLTNKLHWLEKNTKVAVIPNPIDLDKIKEQASLKTKDLNYENYIVSAGRIIPEKGFDLLIEAFSKLKDTTLNLLILGVGSKDQIDFLNSKIQSCNVEERVIMHGFAPNIYPILKKARLCVVSSRIEGFPNVLLQMMSQNNNVVSTTCAGGINEIEGIYNAEPNNVISLTIAIENCLKHDNSSNRALFNSYLKKRNIDHFYNTLIEAIK